MVASPFRDREPIATPLALEVLMRGEIKVVGRMPWSSNATFLVDIDDGEFPVQAIYKPARGERPLWDFPANLYLREIASFAMSEHLGWALVPPTIGRDGPAGEGSLQLCIPHDPEEHYFTLREQPVHLFAFQRLCVFDFVTNNTDRKGGHCLLGTDGHIYAIDNGLSFHEEFKLRTVLWDFSGDDIPIGIVADLERLLDEPLPAAITETLARDEIDAIYKRTRKLVTERRFPVDPTGRRFPWPLV